MTKPMDPETAQTPQSIHSNEEASNNGYGTDDTLARHSNVGAAWYSLLSGWYSCPRFLRRWQTS